MGFEDIFILLDEKSDLLKNVDKGMIKKSGNKSGVNVKSFVDLAQSGFFSEFSLIYFAKSHK